MSKKTGFRVGFLLSFCLLTAGFQNCAGDYASLPRQSAKASVLGNNGAIKGADDESRDDSSQDPTDESKQDPKEERSTQSEHNDDPNQNKERDPTGHSQSREPSADTDQPKSQPSASTPNTPAPTTSSPSAPAPAPAPSASDALFLETRAVYRLYSPSASDHMASLAPNEGAHAGYRLEGLSFRAYVQFSPVRNALFRCRVRSSGSHFVSPSSNCEGQDFEGLLGYASRQIFLQGERALWRCYNPQVGRHLITVVPEECLNNGYSIEGLLGYVK